jgi:LysM repeat protein
MRCYERPNWDAGTSSLPNRQAFANTCITSLDWAGSGSGGGGGTTPPPSVHNKVPPKAANNQHAAAHKIVYYIVEKGDNLTKISRKYGNTVKQLQTWNKIKDPNKIRIGQRIRVK